MDYNRLENESDFEWKVRLCKAKLDKEIDLDWSEIVEILGLDIHPDSLRKMAYGYKEYNEYVGNQPKQMSTDEYLDELRIRKQELQKERQKLSDERTALNKTLRENARGEENWCKLEELIKASGREEFVQSRINNITTSDNDLVVCLSDLHLGMDVKNVFGEYNLDVAKSRLNQYLMEINKLRQLHSAKNAHVVLLGDIISGAIHITTRLENRENAIEQVQRASELISLFLYELSNNFEKVTVSNVAGNHSRIGLKNDVLRDERLDNIVPWYAKAKLAHIDNVVFNDMQFDSTLGVLTIYGKEYLLCHGDYDSYSESGIAKLVMMTGIKPEAIFMGHLHHCSFDNISNVKLIRSGCLGGSVDDYSVSKRLCGKPSQMVCVCNSNGVIAYYPIELD